MPRTPVVALLLTFVVPPLAAQAPVITPQGDPSVDADTIYRLAVDPADYPDEPFVYLLDDGVLRFEADGRGTRTYRQVVQVLTREAAEQWGEQSFSWVADRERLTVNWIRVVRPDGSVVSDGPAHEQETSRPAPAQYPVYTDVKVRRVSVAGIEPGTILDFSYTEETVDPVLAGDFTSGWRVTTGRLTRRSRLILDVPADVTPRIVEENLDFPVETQHANGRRVYLWATQDVPPVEPEPFAGSPNAVSMRIEIAAPLGWDSIASWYAGLAGDRYAVPPELAATFADVVAGAATRDDSLRALHRWVAQDFRYVSLSLGIGGYQPRAPATVFETKLGDCKDKATLFIALARHMGLDAHPVLVALSGKPDSAMPSITQFDHMVAAVGRSAGRLFLDLTAELVPYGQVPPYLQGEIGLLIGPDGRAEVVGFPEDPPQTSRAEFTIAGELLSDGTFRGSYHERRTGAEQYELRQAMTEVARLSATERERLADALANGIFDGASGDSLELFDGRDLRAEPRLGVYLDAPKITTAAGGSYILTLPIPNYANPGLIADLERRGPRKFPIDVSEVNGPTVHRWTLEVTLPAGWRAELPTNVSVAGAYGTYTARYAQEGRALRIVRELAGRRGLEPPERVDGLIEWLRGVGEDDVRFVLLTP